jgi:hypothetical protein
MSRNKQRDWLRDVDAWQRNVVFPDTAENEGRFWRNIISGKQRLSLPQVVGILLIAVAVVAVLTSLWPRGSEVWWRKAIDGYAVFVTLTAALAIFIAVGNRRARRK